MLQTTTMPLSKGSLHSCTFKRIPDETRFHVVDPNVIQKVESSGNRQKEGVLPIPDQAVPGEVWEMQQDLLIREQGLQAVALIVTIVAFRTLAAVHIPVAAVIPVIVRLTLTVVVELLLPVVVFLVAVGLPVVPEAVFPVQVAVADRVPDK